MNIGKIVSVEYDKFQVKLFHTTKTSTISLNRNRSARLIIFRRSISNMTTRSFILSARTRRRYGSWSGRGG